MDIIAKKTYLDTNNTSDCCGCGACAEVCPCGAISFVEGKDKAVYPRIDSLKCINCGKCRQVCAFQDYPIEKDAKNKKAYVAILKNEEDRLKSASGGAFVGIVEALKKKHTNLFVAGAVWQDDLSVKHEVSTANDVDRFRKSKYIQSNTEGIFSKIKEKLNAGNAVLFSGTPCQVAELKYYLKRDYENLYTIDLVCHGVPGNSIFKKYISYLEKKYNKKVKEAGFRHKKKDFYGEVHSDFTKIVLDDGKTIIGNNKTDNYLRGFRLGLYYRDSCYSCPYANPNRISDITIGDYWNIQKKYSEIVDYTGVSCLVINTQKGQKIFDNLDELEIKETTMDYLLQSNSQLIRPSKVHKNRNYFFGEYETKDFDELINSSIGKPKKMKNRISKLLPGKVKRKVKRFI